ncbi:MAG: hypothetical protein ACK5GN_13690 [Pseudomonadota bacterium]|jgi:hypothetical protein
MTAALPESATRLRGQHPTFSFKGYSISPVDHGLRLEFRFSIEPSIDFSPQLTIPLQDYSQAASLAGDPIVQRLTFLIGMVELLSYWKLSCSPRIEIEAGHLSDDEIPFWEKLIRKGLGEFFFLNKIPPSLDFSIIPTAPKINWHGTAAPVARRGDQSTLVLVGGGKDSIVTLELLRQNLPIQSSSNFDSLAALVLNPIPASMAAIHTAQYPPPLVIQRTIDPKLRELNSKGYLNGHTPFSALLAFVSTLTAYANGYRRVVASNEASASEGNVEYHGFEINHQYSKSFEFERDFRGYITKLAIPTEYLSFLRPLNELQICALFSDMPVYHSIFRSCNREQTLIARSRCADSSSAPARSGWCAQCPKCVFTFLCLRCFLDDVQLLSIFGENIRAQPAFDSVVLELAGFSEHKPFECVGTYEEVRACVSHQLANDASALSSSDAALRLRHELTRTHSAKIGDLLNRWNPHHFLDPALLEPLRAALRPLQQRFSP